MPGIWTTRWKIRQVAGSRLLTCQTPVYSLSFPCTCIRIFSLSRGATAVRDLQDMENTFDGDTMQILDCLPPYGQRCDCSLEGMG